MLLPPMFGQSSRRRATAAEAPLIHSRHTVLAGTGKAKRRNVPPGITFQRELSDTCTIHSTSPLISAPAAVAFSLRECLHRNCYWKRCIDFNTPPLREMD